jgi:hypothetical protein
MDRLQILLSVKSRWFARRPMLRPAKFSESPEVACIDPLDDDYWTASEVISSWREYSKSLNRYPRFGAFSGSASFVRDWVFDEAFYAVQAKNRGCNPSGDLWGHFVEVGWNEDLEPSPFFSPSFLKAQLRLRGINPGSADLAFENWDRGQHLSPTLLFDPGHYLVKYPDVARSGLEPYVHWLQFGVFEGRMPAPFVTIRPLSGVGGSGKTALQGIPSIAAFLGTHAELSSLNLGHLAEVFGESELCDRLLSGEVPFMTSPEVLFGALGDVMPQHPDRLQRLAEQ